MLSHLPRMDCRQDLKTRRTQTRGTGAAPVGLRGPPTQIPLLHHHTCCSALQWSASSFSEHIPAARRSVTSDLTPGARPGDYNPLDARQDRPANLTQTL